MRKIKQIALLAGIVAGLSAVSFRTEAAEYINITDYSESFTPNGLDGKLEVSVTGEAGADGYLYIFESVKDMQPFVVSGENLSGDELEFYKEGTVGYYRIKVADVEKPAALNAEFLCSGFYDFPKKAETNGGENRSVIYKFTNHLESGIEKYHVQISIPEGDEIIQVTKPAAYADYILSEADGMRTIGLTKSVASAAAAELAFTYGQPFVSKMSGKLTVWVLCLGIGLFVMADRYKKAKKDGAE